MQLFIVSLPVLFRALWKASQCKRRDRLQHPIDNESAEPRIFRFESFSLDRSDANCIIELIQVGELTQARSHRDNAVQIHISPNDGVAIYQQIVNQIKYLVASGRLSAGEELPPIRGLAEQLLINPNTVARAYRELEMAGIVEKRRTAGTYVSDQGSPLARRERLKILTDRIDQLLAEATQLGVSLEEVNKLVQQRHAAMQANRPEE